MADSIPTPPVVLPGIPTANSSTESSGNIFGKVKESFTNLSSKRLSNSGLLPGASSSRAKKTNVEWQDGSGTVQAAGALGNDWRIHVSVSPDANILTGDVDNILLSPLKSQQGTNGVYFPITPVITTTHTARYSSTNLTHSNYSVQSYEGSEVGEIQINGDFPVQNSVEAQYLLAAIYFFRAATKMFWGTDPVAGTPPPLLYLDGYGSHYFPHVPCVLKSFTHTLPNDVDYIECMPAGKTEWTRVPIMSQIQISLQPVYSRTKVSQFNNTNFARGDLLKGGFI